MAFPYYAVVKKKGESRSATLTFEANNLTDALNEMVRKVNVTDTYNLDSYTLYEIVENGDGYKPVAEKWSEEQRKARLVKAGVVLKVDDVNRGVPVEVATTLPVLVPEPEYTSYEVEVA
jgi:predicted neutral ceramidase superfamily lipid hydrolase